MALRKTGSERLSGILEKLGVAGFLAFAGDIIFSHQLELWVDFAGILASLTVLILSVKISNDEH